MQVTVTIKLEVDMEEWSDLYCTEPTDSAIRSDVKHYCTSTVREQLEMSGFVLTKVRYGV
jgi:hypothetical protein